ncbi:hypothetical protein POJ06DRAFT_267974 [Lipomyces tetrasporus]|uniref:Uncharacterized protein n=1 Tax=Lipomyces tetrasporus TaxID=54092 RepID=A0AAD7QRZ8_9ASCO|nr:uncharacterized protein POJ06DRAFT_267974 [Lipomyces tetrasporus]KAJ8100378.1 hypothetical protein POJ06DRAFT_267974 [Lipomyces tetrasporus]
MISIQDILNPCDDERQQPPQRSVSVPRSTIPLSTTTANMLSPAMSLHSDGDDAEADAEADADDNGSTTSRSDGFVHYECVCAGADSECHVDVPARKVVSHIFGRNKRQTLAIPEHMWVSICRRHYQRESYRKETFPILQTKLVLMQLDKLERWGKVSSFSVIRSKPKRYAPRNSYATPLSPRSQSYPPPANDIDIQTVIDGTVDDHSPHSFAAIRGLLVTIQEYLERETDPSLRVFPNIEILPNIEGPLAYVRRGRKRGSSSSSESTCLSEDISATPKRRRSSVAMIDRQPLMLAPKPTSTTASLPPARSIASGYSYHSYPEPDLRRLSNESDPRLFPSPRLGFLQYRQIYVHS